MMPPTRKAASPVAQVEREVFRRAINGIPVPGGRPPPAFAGSPRPSSWSGGHNSPWRSPALDGASSPKVGSRVFVNIRGYMLAGTCAFTGPTQFCEGTWVGVILDCAAGKNDGAINGLRYFSCSPQHGVFVRPDTVMLAPEEVARGAFDLGECGGDDQAPKHLGSARSPRRRRTQSRQRSFQPVGVLHWPRSGSSGSVVTHSPKRGAPASPTDVGNASALEDLMREAYAAAGAATALDDSRGAVAMLEGESYSLKEASTASSLLSPELDDAHATISRLETELAQMREAAAASASATSEFEQARAMISRLEVELAESKEAVAEVEAGKASELKEANSKIASLEEKLQTAEEVRSKSSNADGNAVQLGQLPDSAELLEARALIEKLQAQLAETQEDREVSLDTELSVVALRSEAQTSKKLESARAMVEMLEEQLDEHRKEVAELEAKLAQVQEEHSRQLDETSRKTESLQGRVGELESELAAAQREAEDAKIARKKAMSDLRAARGSEAGRRASAELAQATIDTILTSAAIASTNDGDMPDPAYSGSTNEVDDSGRPSLDSARKTDMSQATTAAADDNEEEPVVAHTSSKKGVQVVEVARSSLKDFDNEVANKRKASVEAVIALIDSRRSSLVPCGTMVAESADDTHIEAESTEEAGLHDTISPEALHPVADENGGEEPADGVEMAEENPFDGDIGEAY